ncbi:hypothetical protein [Urechidicola vernalis]|uniref:Uncharacterized protein n=1 Tax=Urechidicola vernalis TaxID=3075600 RepID=A0ABU2Y1R9_9FLAO|nr:hypothetical protein [Urechidicola sp. P050]MDT0551730.1 hypothetical protein [Urechidicola sp. P050]
MNPKYKKLLLSILLDGIGMLSFVIPGAGEFMDIVWAPLSAYLILKLYKGTFAKVASLISFGEEAGFIGTDIIPTFTLSWIYEQVFVNKTPPLIEE